MARVVKVAHAFADANVRGRRIRIEVGIIALVGEQDDVAFGIRAFGVINVDRLRNVFAAEVCFYFPTGYVNRRGRKPRGIRRIKRYLRRAYAVEAHEMEVRRKLRAGVAGRNGRRWD